MTANQLTKVIIEYLTLYRHFVWRQNIVGRVRGRKIAHKKGVPDILGISANGKWIAIEVKVGRDEQSEAQRAFQYEIERRGGIYVVARSIEDVQKVGL